MPWKYNGKTIREGRSWANDDEIIHPRNWASVWSDEDKTNAGLVWEDAPASSLPVDTRFYWGRDNDGNPIARDLDDSNATDADGSPILDIDGNQIVNYGLKTTTIREIKVRASGLLQDTDWYVTRKSESDVAIPENILTYRAAVRTKSGEIEDAINACTTLEELMALYEVPIDENMNPTGNSTIEDWPTLEE